MDANFKEYLRAHLIVLLGAVDLWQKCVYAEQEALFARHSSHQYISSAASLEALRKDIAEFFPLVGKIEAPDWKTNFQYPLKSSDVFIQVSAALDYVGNQFDALLQDYYYPRFPTGDVFSLGELIRHLSGNLFAFRKLVYMSQLKDARLYLILSSGISSRPLVEVAHQAVLGGVDIIQLREKNLASVELEALARKLREVIPRSVMYIINDNPVLAARVKADGVHLGQEDETVTKARKIVGREAIIGVSARTVELAEKARREGADYIGSGAAFPTDTKENAVVNGPDKLAAIQESTSLPLYAIGGINLDNVDILLEKKLERVVVCRAILEAEDVEAAVRQWREKLYPGE